MPPPKKVKEESHAGGRRAERTGQVEVIGRESELDTLTVAIDEANLVTLTGPPGVGKSALVRAFVALRKRRKSKLSSLEVDLVGRSGASTVLLECARTLRLPLQAEPAPSALTAQIGRALDHLGQAIVVLDNADAARDALADMLVEWLRSAPRARFIVTSRTALAMSWQKRIALRALSTPPRRELSASAIAKFDAVRLFVRRAASASAAYRFDDANAPDVADIVRLLEGNPLALELCAARTPILSEREMAQLLRREGFITEGAADWGRPLANAISWTWDQLSAEDSSLLERCAIFRGSFDLDAVRAVATTDATPILATIEALTRLERSSLIEPFVAEPLSAPRYRLPESIRAVGMLRLKRSGMLDAVVERHMAHYGRLSAIRADTGVRRLDRDNLEGALDAATRLGAPAYAAKLLIALRPLVLAQGPLEPYCARIDALVSVRGLGRVELADLHLSRGLARIFAGRRDEALIDLRAAEKLARKGNAPDVRTMACSKRALILGLKGERPEATTLFAEAHALAEASSDPYLRGVVLTDNGNVLSEWGDNDAAMTMLASACDFLDAAGAVREGAFARLLLASRQLDTGLLAHALREATVTLEALEGLGDDRSSTWARCVLALTEQELGRLPHARIQLETAIERARIVGDSHTEGLLLGYLGNVCLEQGLSSDALTVFRRARRHLEVAGDRGAGAMAFAGAALAELELGRAAAARAHVARAEELLAGDARSARRRAVTLISELVTGKRASNEDAERRREPSTRTAGRAGSEEERFARRMIDRLSASRYERDGVESKTVVIARDATWVLLPSGGLLRLNRSRSLRSILGRLVSERLKYPGRAVGIHALVRAGWPDEAILPSAAKNRLHVAVARLRRLGLDTMLEQDDGGYLLKPDVPLRISDDVGPPPGAVEP
jgi:predicted ATPase